MGSLCCCCADAFRARMARDVPLLAAAGDALPPSGAGASAFTSAPAPAPLPVPGTTGASSAVASGAPPGDAATAPAAAGNEAWVAWVSVNPRGDEPHLDVYPGHVARAIEAAWRRGDSTCALGPMFFDAVVHLGDAPTQRRQNARRDVRRVPLARLGAEVSLQVFQHRHGWRVAGAQEEGFAEEARAVIPEDSAVPLAEDALLLVRSPVRATEPAPGDPEAVVPLWEWCKELARSPEASRLLPEGDWGVYSAEQNNEIERAFAAGAAETSITVGVREYQIVFGQDGFAHQVDTRLRKRRLVRRRLMAPDKRDRRLQPPESITSMRGQDTCAICCSTFSETASMPTVEVPRCHHIFHQACVQHIADNDRPCPCCRGEVDWSSLVQSLRRRRQ
mmetsp:Transcript_22805/g.65754  ORF Transcript_22805/g.65754 Transcript_22805/m.65754 type:complete len:391 (-) Transcript_22805:96-1268(-)